MPENDRRLTVIISTISGTIAVAFFAVLVYVSSIQQNTELHSKSKAPLAGVHAGRLPTATNCAALSMKQCLNNGEPCIWTKGICILSSLRKKNRIGLGQSGKHFQSMAALKRVKLQVHSVANSSSFLRCRAFSKEECHQAKECAYDMSFQQCTSRRKMAMSKKREIKINKRMP